MGWELGAGLGHVQPLLSVARALASHGHQPVFAVKNLLEAAPLLGAESFPVLQSPQWPPRPAPAKPFRAATFADILAIRGFADADELLPVVRAWQSLIDLVRPDLIVCDHSPTLCLAAYRSVPVAMIGTGFTVPPAEHPEFPSLGTGVEPQMPHEKLLAVVREVQRRRNRPAPDTLPGLFADCARFVCTVPELDPYNSVRSQPALGSFNPLPPAPPPASPPSFFAYLTTDFRAAEKVLSYLADLKVPGSAFVRGASKPLVESLRAKGLEMYATPAPMHEVLPRVSVILHHGGLLTSEDALATGRPQLLLPRYLEQELTARALRDLGVAHALAGRYTLQHVSQAMHQLMADPRFMRQAGTLAATIHARGRANPVEQIVTACLQTLAAN
jgi:UDP:flavonoid glycosyltransferase YjiC (YdhE family)